MDSLSKFIEPYGLHKLLPTWIERAISASFNPELAKVNFERFLSRLVETDSTLLGRLDKRNIPWISLLFSGSQILTEMAMKDPMNLFAAIQPSVLHSTRFKAEMRRERDSLLKSPTIDAKEALCAFKNRELMRIGWRDLLKWADTVETLEDLSRLADTCIEGALQVAEKEAVDKFGFPLHEDGSRASFIVLGLGKLGGRELNFSSDIDLIYMYDRDDGQTSGGIGPNHLKRPKISIQEFYTRVAQRLTSLLNDIGPSGNIYRVDLALRPEGSRGQLVISLPASEIYYESWGHPWERQMLIKARVCAGDPLFGDKFREMIRPFVYRKFLDYSHIKEIHQMKEKIDKHLTKGKDKYKNNVKLGKGGIREIEFIIQTYQLIYGGKMPWLAETNSLKALHRIFERGLLGNVQYAQLADALLFLRDLENRMQITYGRQVQILPDREDELQVLALKMNLKGKDELLHAYKQATDNAHDIFTDFFKEEKADSTIEESEYHIDLDNEEDALKKLEELQFSNPRIVLDSLLHIRDGEPFNHPSSKSRRMFMRLLPELIGLIVTMPEKERTLVNLDKFLSSQEGREGVYEILLELPSSREVLITIFSLAQSLAEIMTNQPDAVEILASGLSAGIKHSLTDVPESIVSYDTKLDWLRKERNAESIRAGISYMLSHNDPFELMEDLSLLADEFVSSCFKIIEDEFLTDENIKDKTCFTVIGMGKLGRRELNYGSDLDLMFVFSEEGASDETGAFYANLSRKLINAIGGISQHGYAYKVDTRLRPEGEKGGIVISEKAAFQYYSKRGALWERMALCGGRAIAGDVGFGGKFLRGLDNFVYSGGISKNDVEAISAMKIKIEREKIKQFKALPIKYGRGGIVDIEFLAQKLKLSYGMEMEKLRTYNTLEMLEAAIKEEWGIPDLERLVRSYKLQRTVETHLRIETGRSAENLPFSTDQLRILEQKLERFVSLNGSLVDTVTDSMEAVKKSISHIVKV